MKVTNCLIFPKPGADVTTMFDPAKGELDGYVILPHADYDALAARLAEEIENAATYKQERDEIVVNYETEAAQLTEAHRQNADLMAIIDKRDEALGFIPLDKGMDMMDELREAKARLAEAEQTRAHELAYVIETCAAMVKLGWGDARVEIRDLKAWATSRAAVRPADSAPAVTPFCGPFPEQSEDERTLRYMLAIRCGGPGELYGDDGELQLGGFPYPIDFRRDSVAEIRRKLDARGMAKLAEQLKAADSAEGGPK